MREIKKYVKHKGQGHDVSVHRPESNFWIVGLGLIGPGNSFQITSTDSLLFMANVFGCLLIIINAEHKRSRWS